MGEPNYLKVYVGAIKPNGLSYTCTYIHN